MVSLTTVATTPAVCGAPAQTLESTKAEEQVSTCTTCVDQTNLVAKADDKAAVDAQAELKERADIADVENKA